MQEHAAILNVTSLVLLRVYFASLMQVVGIHEEACEVLFDAEFPGGMDLNGRWALSLPFITLIYHF